MAITLNFTTINSCDSTTGLTASGNIPGSGNGSLQTSDFTQQQGTDCVEFGINAASGSGTITATASSFNSEVNDVSCWFLNPGFNNSGAAVLINTDDSVQIWLSDGTVTAYYNQGGSDSSPNPLPGGWSLLRCNGSATPNETTGGTWNSTRAQAVTSVGIRVKNAAVNSGKSDTRYGLDWFKYHDKIIITGGTALVPIEMAEVEVTDRDIASGGGRWGLVNQTDIFFDLYCGLEFGDGTTSTFFADENKILFFNQFGPSGEYEINVLNNATVRFGLKDDDGASGVEYAVNGCVLRPGLGNPNLTVNSTGVIQLYGSRLQGWGTIDLGSGGTGAIDMINLDLFNNTELRFRSTGLNIDTARLHFSEGSEADVGSVESIPTNMSNIRVFQCSDGLDFQVTMTVNGYIAGDNTFDIVVQEGDTVTMLDSEFNIDKIARSI